MYRLAMACPLPLKRALNLPLRVSSSPMGRQPAAPVHASLTEPERSCRRWQSPRGDPVRSLDSHRHRPPRRRIPGRRRRIRLWPCLPVCHRRQGRSVCVQLLQKPDFNQPVSSVSNLLAGPEAICLVGVGANSGGLAAVGCWPDSHQSAMPSKSRWAFKRRVLGGCTEIPEIVGGWRFLQVSKIPPVIAGKMDAPVAKCSVVAGRSLQIRAGHTDHTGRAPPADTGRNAGRFSVPDSARYGGGVEADQAAHVVVAGHQTGGIAAVPRRLRRRLPSNQPAHILFARSPDRWRNWRSRENYWPRPAPQPCP